MLHISTSVLMMEPPFRSTILKMINVIEAWETDGPYVDEERIDFVQIDCDLSWSILMLNTV